ncbi:unnamed protein product [Urochloa humidicola]
MSPPPTAGSQPLDPRLPARRWTPHPLLDPALVHRRTSPLSTPGAATRPCARGSPLLTPNAPRRPSPLGSPAAGAQSLRTPALLPAAAGFCRPRSRNGTGDRWEHAAARAPCSYASTVRRRWPDLQELAASRLSPPRVLKQKTNWDYLIRPICFLRRRASAFQQWRIRLYERRTSQQDGERAA